MTNRGLLWVLEWERNAYRKHLGCVPTFPRLTSVWGDRLARARSSSVCRLLFPPRPFWPKASLRGAVCGELGAGRACCEASWKGGVWRVGSALSRESEGQAQARH